MRKVLTILFGLSIVLGLSAAEGGCKEQPNAPHSPRKVEPAPNPDPAKPPKDKPFPGNVSLTFWLEQASGKKTVIAYNVGAGYQSHSCDRSCHWDAIAKPNQLVTFTVTYFTPGTVAHLSMQVVQNNNGRIVCQDTNTDGNNQGGISGQGVIVI